MEKTFTWTLAADAKEIVAPLNEAFSITVVPTGTAATNLTITGVSMRAEETRAQLGRDHITICKEKKEKTENCTTPTFPAGVATPAYVRFTTSEIPHGTYAGTIDLRVDESAEIKSLPMTFSRSSPWAKFWGAMAILLGIATSLYVTMYSRLAISQAEALLPASRLRDLVAARRARLSECGAAPIAKRLVGRLNTIHESLGTSKLREAGYIRSIISRPFGGETASDKYAEFLQSTGDHLATIGYLIQEGFCRAAELIDKNPAHLDALHEAFRKLDELETEKRTPEMLAPDVQRILGQLVIDITPKKEDDEESVHAFPLLSVGEFPSTEQLLLRISTISGIVWLIWAAITTLTGYLAMIAIDAGFGTPIDFAKCFLWGLGVQIAGQQLQNLSPTAVTSALNITAPKS